MAVQRRFNCSPDQVFAVLHDGWISRMGRRSVPNARCRRRLAGSRHQPAPPVWGVAAGDRGHHRGPGVPARQAPRTRSARLAGRQSSRGHNCQTRRQWLVSIAEDVTDGPATLVPEPVPVNGIDVRNRETLRRLAYLAERRTQAAILDSRLARRSIGLPGHRHRVGSGHAIVSGPVLVPSNVSTSGMDRKINC
jgi:hypothetical protein